MLDTSPPSTPLLDQYFTLKREAPDAILLFRVGDFYEAYGEDAKSLSRALEIVLTGRDVRGTRVPMAGVPHQSLENHLKTLLEQGCKIAISEQLEEASGTKKLIHRDIVRFLTPGTVLEPEFLEEKEPNYLMAIWPGHRSYALSWCDVSTGSWFTCALAFEGEILFREISKVSPKEIVVPEECAFISEIEKRYSGKLSTFHSPAEPGIDLPPAIPPEARKASVFLYAYLSEIYRGKPPRLSGPNWVGAHQFLVLDPLTIRNLELLRNLASGSKEGSLLELLDQTKTSMGGRLLREWLTHPRVDRAEIENRHDAVSELLFAPRSREEMHKRLSGLGDLQRLAARVSFRTANARDLLAIKLVLKEIPELIRFVKSFRSAIFVNWLQKMPDLSALHVLLERALNENPPLGLKEGNLIRKGYHLELDRHKEELQDAIAWIAALEESERKATGIKSLKVGFNQVFGYYLEVTRSNFPQVPSHYIRKQTLANAERFIIESLKMQEAKILGGQEKSKNLECEIFLEVREEVRKKEEELGVCALLLAELDCLVSLAFVAEQQHFCRPKMNDAQTLSIQSGRHPVVESSNLGAFVPNDCFMDSEEDRLIVLTGPNMAGKSTYLRQVAIMVILAQMGSFTPAESAELPIVDRVFTRIGASDDLHRGESTFFVEMKETAEILKYATRKSLILLDEIGRGTSTFDGLSLAWATAEELLRKHAKVLFATHYHEMTLLAGRASGVRNYTVAVAEQGEEVIFLHQIIPGGADKSYGIHVARLAGIPFRVVERAREVLRDLENREVGIPGDLPAFERQNDKDKRLAQLEKAVRETDVHNLTGLEALNLLASWKEGYLHS